MVSGQGYVVDIVRELLTLAEGEKPNDLAQRVSDQVVDSPVFIQYRHFLSHFFGCYLR